MAATHQVPHRVFETLRTYNSRIRAFDLHYKRLIKSWVTLYKEELLSAQIDDVMTTIQSKLIPYNLWPIQPVGIPKKNLNSNEETEWVIRIFLTSDLDLHIDVTKLDQSYVHRPFTVMSVCIQPQYPPVVKQTERSIWNEKKHLLGCNEILLCSSSGRPLETNNSNFWVLELDCSPDQLFLQLSKHTEVPLQGLRWYTHPLDGQILAGVTRALLIPILRSLGAQVIEQPLTPLPTQKRQYYFLTSTLKSISWVSSLDNQPQSSSPFMPLLFSLIDRYLSKC